MMEAAFHIGFLVPDLSSAMDAYGRQFGLEWCDEWTIQQPAWTPSSGQVTVPLRLTFSKSPHFRVELIEGPPGSLWDGHAAPGLHHVGVWSDDLVADADALVDEGWAVIGAHKPRSPGYGFAVYLSHNGVGLVELVSTKIRPALEAWWAE